MTEKAKNDQNADNSSIHKTPPNRLMLSAEFVDPSMNSA